MLRFANGLLIAAALLPAALAVAAQVAPPPLASLPAAPRRAALAFQQYSVNLREVYPRPILEAHFDFVNRGEHPVTITELKPSCGCLRPQLLGDIRHYAPGERGRFYITLHTANETPGPHGYTIDVRYDQPQPRTETLTFRVRLPAQKISVQPPEVYFYQLAGEAGEQTISVIDARESSLEVVSARCTLDFVKTEVLPVETDAGGQTRTPIRISVPEGVAPGRQTGYVVIETKDPGFPRLHAAIAVHGPAGVRPAGFDADAASSP